MHISFVFFQSCFFIIIEHDYLKVRRLLDQWDFIVGGATYMTFKNILNILKVFVHISVYISSS